MTDSPTAQLPGSDDVVAQIQAALAELGDVSTLTPAEASVRFDVLHGELQSALADLDRA